MPAGWWNSNAQDLTSTMSKKQAHAQLVKIGFKHTTERARLDQEKTNEDRQPADATLSVPRL